MVGNCGGAKKRCEKDGQEPTVTDINWLENADVLTENITLDAMEVEVPTGHLTVAKKRYSFLVPYRSLMS